jgi:hypothetical protein
LYPTGGLLGGVDFYRMTSAWSEGTGAISPLDGATWDTSNGTTAWTSGADTYPVKVNAMTRITVANAWVDLEATDLVTAWLDARDFPIRQQ